MKDQMDSFLYIKLVQIYVIIETKMTFLNHVVLIFFPFAKQSKVFTYTI